jgi:hypothetical protein
MALGCLVLDKPWCQLSPHALALLKDAAVVYEQGSSTYIPSTLVRRAAPRRPRRLR